MTRTNLQARSTAGVPKRYEDTQYEGPRIQEAEKGKHFIATFERELNSFKREKIIPVVSTRRSIFLPLPRRKKARLV
jgi:hypothetical protein